MGLSTNTVGDSFKWPVWIWLEMLAIAFFKAHMTVWVEFPLPGITSAPWPASPERWVDGKWGNTHSAHIATTKCVRLVHRREICLARRLQEPSWFNLWGEPNDITACHYRTGTRERPRCTVPLKGRT